MPEKGGSLFEKLSQLKYPNIHKFNPSSFDWLFDNEDALPFLEWFCSSVQSSNLVTDSELEKFENLKKKGVTTLEGRRLIEALDNQPAVTSLSELTSEIQELEKIKEELTYQKQTCISQLNIFNLKEKEISKKIGDFNSNTINEEINEEATHNKLKYKDAMLTEAFVFLEHNMSKIQMLLTSNQLLCQHSFTDYLQLEEECTAYLTDCAHRKFEQNMGQMGQNSGLELCVYLQVGHPNFGDILGLDEKTRSIQNWELNFLQNQLSIAEQDRIMNEVQLASLRTALETCKNFDSQVLNEKLFINLENTRERLASLEQKSNAYRRELLALKNVAKNAAFKATQLRCSSIIVGDCSLKLLRQDFFISKQKEFLSLLVQQWAREQLVVLALRLESRQLETLLSEFKNVSRDLLEVNCELTTRSGILKQLLDVFKRLHNRNMIPRNDELACSLERTLALDFNLKRAPTNYEDLGNLALQLHKLSEEGKLNLNQLKNTSVSQLKDLEKWVSYMEGLLFGTTLNGITQKLSVPERLEESLNGLDRLIDGIQRRLKPLHREFKSKQLVFKNDHLVALERRLWTFFYNDVNSMLRKTDALNAKAATM